MYLRLPRALLAALSLVGSTVAPLVAPVSAAAGSADVMAVGDEAGYYSIAESLGYKRFPAGPDVGAPTAVVNASAHTVDLSVEDGGRRSTVTMAWPMRVGRWNIGLGGGEPEEHVRVQRGNASCTVTAGALDVREAAISADGGVAVLTADLQTGSCSLGSNVGGYTGVSVRIGGTALLPAVGRATPAVISTGAVAGTTVSRRVEVANVGASPWRIRAAGVSSTASWHPLFAVVPGSDTCTGATLEPGGQCAVTVSATAPSYRIDEHVVIAGDGVADVVVPVVLEGYRPVPAPTGVTAVAGRSSLTISWNAPAVDPGAGYRVYDVAAGSRVQVAAVAGTARSVRVAGPGPRRLAIVAANGRFAESPDTVVETAGVTQEIMAEDHYGTPVGFAVPAAGATAAARTSTLPRYIRLNAARTSWVAAGSEGVLVCAADTESCVPVAGTGPTGPGEPGEAVWLPDGRIAFSTATGTGTTVWAIRPDGTGLRRVALLTSPFGFGQLTAAPDGTQVLLRGGPALTVVRVRLSDGHVTEVPGTQDVDDFTVTTSGRLVLERRLDMTASEGPRRITVTGLDGTGSKDLALPAGDNREVTFDASGTRVAFVRHTSEWNGTVWIASADGSGAREVSPLSGTWRGIQWSQDDGAAPTATLAVPTVTGAATVVRTGAGDADDQAGALRRQCRLDAATTWTTCGSTWSLSGLAAGKHTALIRVLDPSGRLSPVVSRSWTVDRTAPSSAVAPLPSVQVTTDAVLSWTSTDTGGAGTASSDVRMRRASPSGRWSGYQYPARWQRHVPRSVPLRLTPGYQYCFSVRTRDSVGNVGSWSAARCTSVILDDRSLSASRGWTRGTAQSYALGTWTRTTRTAASLTRRSVSARRLAVVAATCPSCGAVDVYHAGTRIGRVDLVSPRTSYRRSRWLPLQPTTRTGTVVLRTVNAKPVRIDGIAVQH